MTWERETWVDDDGSLTVGTLFDADHMNNIEDGIEESGTALDEAVGALETLLGGKQPLDSDLTAIAALTTTEFGRSFLVLAGASAARTLLGLGTAAVEPSSAFQPADSDLTAIAALTTTSFGRSILTQASAEATRTLLGLGTAAVKASTDFQAADSDLAAIAALSTTEFGRSLLTQASASAARTALGLGTAAVEPSSAFQAADSDLTAIAALTTTSFGRELLTLAGGEAARSVIGAASAAALSAETSAREAADANIGKGLIACRLATAAALPAYTRTSNKLEANANGALSSIDGETAAVGDFVLLKNGAAGADNGVYKVLSVGSAGTKWSMERVPELDASTDAVPGLIVTIAAGAKNPDRQYSLTTDGPITLNTTALTFTLVAPRDWGLVSSLPKAASCLVGDMCSYIASAEDSVIWRLTYDGEGEEPWKKIGGPPLISKTSVENSTASTTYVTLANSPSIITPAVKMTANVRIGARLIVTSGPSFAYATMFTSGGAEVSATAGEWNSGAPHGGSIFKAVSLAASTTYTLRYKTSTGTSFWNHRYIEIDPVRVG
jgi:hypothetical protein